MSQIALTMLIIALMLGSALSGSYLYRLLSERHRSQATMDFVRTIAGLLTTFTALILGLLLNEVNSNFNKAENDLRSYGSTFISLSSDLDVFGSQGKPVRSLLEQYLRSVIIETWPEEKRPSGEYVEAKASPQDGEVDAENLGALLKDARTKIQHLEVRSEDERAEQMGCLSRMAAIMDERWKLVSEAHATLSSPLITMMVLWLMIVFASFGVTAPRHIFSAVWIAIIALSSGGAVFTILELDGPLDGVVRVSSEPLRHALYHLDGFHLNAPRSADSMQSSGRL